MKPLSQERFRVIDRSQVDNGQAMLVVRSCDDCACPSYPVMTHKASDAAMLGLDEWVVRTQDLYFESLPDGYWAVFNPTGDAGVVVVDAATRHLLDSFSIPTMLGAALASYPDNIAAENAIGRMLDLQLLHPTGRRCQIHLDPNEELIAWLHVTNQCNLACTYCYVRFGNECMLDETGRAAVDAVVRSAIAESYPAIKLKFAGGEAGLVLDLVFDLHDYATRSCQSHQLQLRSVLLSNGVSLIGKDLAGLLDRDIRVMVSLDGLSNSHDRQRPLRSGKPSSRKVLMALDALIEAGIRPHLSITVTAQNCDELHQVVRYALVRDLTFSLNLYRELSHNCQHPELECNQEKLVAALRQAFQVIGEHLPRHSVVGTILDRGHLIAPHLYACGAGRDYMVIDHHGNISRCQMDMSNVVGTVWDDQPLRMIRQFPHENHFPPVTSRAGCQTCRWRFFCAGGCPLMTYQTLDRVDDRSPYCQVYQAIYPLAVQLEGLRLLKYSQDAEPHLYC